MTAHDNMLDQLGIYQHHDAVSGTSNQRVANDYWKRMAQAIDQNQNATSDLIDYFMKKNTGMSAGSTW
jgi:alpha-mannosidase